MINCNNCRWKQDLNDMCLSPLSDYFKQDTDLEDVTECEEFYNDDLPYIESEMEGLLDDQ